MLMPRYRASKPPHGPREALTPPARAPARRGRPAVAWRALCTSALALAAFTAGCGETSQKPTASTTPSNATQTTPATTQPAPATTATQAAHTSAPGKPAAHRTASSKARHASVRSTLSSLANAKPAPKSTPAQLSKLAVADIQLTSPAIDTATGGPAIIASQYTCQGSDRSPALHWQGIPAGTAELALFAISTTPVDNKLFFDWALAGINPSQNGIPAGQLPAGAIPGRNSYGTATYKLCPPNGKPETYVFALFALPKTLHPTAGFDPATLRKQALHTAHHSGLLIATTQHA
jgi:phosphatidylethanolamine-binding protein (PEBP) family uncharacterized protein